jgi:hypothetical protein
MYTSSLSVIVGEKCAAKVENTERRIASQLSIEAEWGRPYGATRGKVQPMWLRVRLLTDHEPAFYLSLIDWAGPWPNIDAALETGGDAHEIRGYVDSTELYLVGDACYVTTVSQHGGNSMKLRREEFAYIRSRLLDFEEWVRALPEKSLGGRMQL